MAIDKTTGDKKSVSKVLASMSDSPITKMRAHLRAKKGKEYENIRVALNDDTLKQSLPHISSGSITIDFLIGGEPNMFGVAPCPGFPRGRVSQVWGHESAGKTTLCLEAVASVCKNGGTAVYIDWENDIVPDYAAALGVPINDESKFELLQPETLEDGIKYAMAYAAAGVDLIVFDSVGSAVPRRIAERDVMDVAEQGKIAELQSVWSQELPNLKNLIAQTGTAVVGISQVRATMSQMGAQSKPQGGNAWKFYSSIRLELTRIKNEKSKEHNLLTHKADERVVGGIIKATAVKNKLSKSQGRQELFYIRWGEGIDNIRTMIEIASAHGIIKKSGSWLEWSTAPGGPIKLLGVEKFRQHFVENKSHQEALLQRVMPLLGGGKSLEGFTSDESDEDGSILPGIVDESGDDGDASDPESGAGVDLQDLDI